MNQPKMIVVVLLNALAVWGVWFLVNYRHTKYHGWRMILYWIANFLFLFCLAWLAIVAGLMKSLWGNALILGLAVVYVSLLKNLGQH